MTKHIGFTTHLEAMKQCQAEGCASRASVVVIPTDEQHRKAGASNTRLCASHYASEIPEGYPHLKCDMDAYYDEDYIRKEWRRATS